MEIDPAYALFLFSLSGIAAGLSFVWAVIFSMQ